MTKGGSSVAGPLLFGLLTCDEIWLDDGGERWCGTWTLAEAGELTWYVVHRILAKEGKYLEIEHMMQSAERKDMKII